jgi:hypothetical protein
MQVIEVVVDVNVQQRQHEFEFERAVESPVVDRFRCLLLVIISD